MISKTAFVSAAVMLWIAEWVSQVKSVLDDVHLVMFREIYIANLLATSMTCPR